MPSKCLASPRAKARAASLVVCLDLPRSVPRLRRGCLRVTCLDSPAELQVTRHVRLVSAEILSLANKLETLHAGKDTLGDPLFGGQQRIPYTVEKVREAFRRGESALAPPAQPRHHRRFGRQKTQSPPSTEPTEAQTVERLFRKQLLGEETSQALAGLLVHSKAMREQAASLPEAEPAVAPTPPSQRGTRILRLMLEDDYEWAPILRRIAGYIYSPAFHRCYLPVIVQTQVVHQTRAQRKVFASFIVPVAFVGAARAQSHGHAGAQRAAETSS